MKDLDAVTTSRISADTPLATIALRGAALAAVLDRHRLDFCCRGARTLSGACADGGLDADVVLAELEAEAGSAATAVPDWSARPISELVDFLVSTHHTYTRVAIARIAPLLAKVVARHQAHRSELAAVSGYFDELAAELAPHLSREERVLFPYLRALAGEGEVPPPLFGPLLNPVRAMMREHDRAGQLLDRLFDATGAFVAPPDACASYQALYAALADLRLDLLRHVSLENNVLFPRALALEEQRRGDVAHTTESDPARSLSTVRPNGRTMRP